MAKFTEELDLCWKEPDTNRSLIRKDINFSNGIYFWFANRETVNKLIGENCTCDLVYHDYMECRYYLMYIGIGPRNINTQKQFIRERILNCHLGSKITISTFRQTLSALLEMEATGKNRKLFITHEEELKITRLINEGFLLGLCQRDKPWDYERELIRSNAPPLNLQGNEAGKCYQFVWGKRAEQRIKANF